MTLESTLRIRPGEGRRTALLFAHLALASAVFYLGRTARDTLFLSRYPLSALPWMFIVYGIASAAVAVLYARLADRLPRQRQIAAVSIAGAITFVLAWVLVRRGAAWIYPVFYVWTDIVSTLLIVQCWTLANDLNDARAAKRLYGLIGSARLLAAVLVGLAAGALVRSIGTAQLILVLAALMGGIVVVAAQLGAIAPAERGERGAAAPRRLGRAPGVLADRYLRLLGLVLLLAFTAVNIGDFQFKAIARASYREDQLASFFALFYAGTGTIAFLFQLFLTPRILSRLGVGAGMAVMPAGFGLASAGLLAWPGLAWATLMKFADSGFQFAIQETTFQALYVPFPAERKVRSRAFLEAVVKPAGFALGGAIVLAAGAGALSRPAMLSLISLPLVVLWLLLIPRVKREYLRQLEQTLSSRGAFALDQEFQLDASGRQSLLQALRTGTGRQIVAALEQLASERSAEVRAAVAELTRHDDAAVRRAALQHLAGQPGEPAPSIRDALADGEPSVRAAAALAWAASARDDSVDALVPLLNDDASDVRVNALAGLLKHGGVEGSIVGGVELGRLLQSPRREDLVGAARALAWLGPGAYRPLRRLLEDADPVVRRAALRAAPGVADARLVPVLLRHLEDPAVRKRAGNALVAVGSAAIGPLARLLGDARADRSVRLEVPRLLRRIAVPQSYDALREQADDVDSRLRLRIYAAMGELQRALQMGPLQEAPAMALITRELAEARRNEAGWAAARQRYSTPLLEEMFAVRRQRVVRRVLRILELRYDRAALKLVRDGLGDATRRANALEVLDALLDAPVRSLVMPYLDGPPTAPMPASDGGLAFMQAHANHPNPYFAMLARHALGEDAMYSTVEKILLLKSAPVFERVIGEDLAPLARVAEVELYSPGTVIMKEGDSGDALYIVVRGRVEVSRRGQRLTELGPGDSLGEMSVLDRASRSATATALEETELLRIGSDEFYEILHEQVEIAEGVIRVLCTRLRQLDERITGRSSLA